MRNKPWPAHMPWPCLGTASATTSAAPPTEHLSRCIAPGARQRRGGCGRAECVAEKGSAEEAKTLARVGFAWRCAQGDRLHYSTHLRRSRRRWRRHATRTACPQCPQCPNAHTGAGSRLPRGTTVCVCCARLPASLTHRGSGRTGPQPA